MVRSNPVRFRLSALLALFLVFQACSSSDKEPAADTKAAVDTVDSGSLDSQAGQDAQPLDTGEEPEVAPAELRGPYPVAATKVTFVDEARSRTLPGTIWYPGRNTSGKLMGYFEGAVPRTDVWEDGAPSTKGPFPLIIFSHGHTAFREQSYFLTEYLASHGYVVAAADHIENDFFTHQTRFFAKSSWDRPRDVGLEIDTVLAWNQEDGNLLQGLVDETRIGVVGHSFGGYTAIASLNPELNARGMLARCNEMDEAEWTGEWVFCHEIAGSDLSYIEDCNPCRAGDERLLAAVSLTPAFPQLIVEGGIASIDRPVLVMGGSSDETTPVETQVKLYWQQLTHQDSMYLELAKASHYSFTSVCDIPFVAGPAYSCEGDFLNAQRGWDLINTATTAFLGLHIKGQEGYRRYFTQDLPAQPEVTLELQQQ